jgi:hypothetical protein
MKYNFAGGDIRSGSRESDLLTAHLVMRFRVTFLKFQHFRECISGRIHG